MSYLLAYTCPWHTGRKRLIRRPTMTMIEPFFLSFSIQTQQHLVHAQSVLGSFGGFEWGFSALLFEALLIERIYWFLLFHSFALGWVLIGSCIWWQHKKSWALHCMQSEAFWVVCLFFNPARQLCIFFVQRLCLYMNGRWMLWIIYGVDACT